MALSTVSHQRGVIPPYNQLQNVSSSMTTDDGDNNNNNNNSFQPVPHPHHPHHYQHHTGLGEHQHQQHQHYAQQQQQQHQHQHHHSCMDSGTSSPPLPMDANSANKVLKHKRRFCRYPNCPRIVKSQGLCQRHGAKPRKCKVDGCDKQAQGNFERMCKLHFKESRRQHQQRYAAAAASNKNAKSSTTSTVTHPPTRTPSRSSQATATKVMSAAAPPPPPPPEYQTRDTRPMDVPNVTATSGVAVTATTNTAPTTTSANTATTTKTATTNQPSSTSPADEPPPPASSTPPPLLPPPSSQPPSPDLPPPQEGTSVYDAILPNSISFLPKYENDVMPLVAHLREGFEANKPTAWHRNEERRARGLVPVTKPSIQLEGWERELVWMEILVLTGTPSANFRHLARAWGRDKGFHTIISQFICERHGDVERKPRQRTIDTSRKSITKKNTRTPLAWASDGIHLPGGGSDDDDDDDDDYDDDSGDCEYDDDNDGDEDDDDDEGTNNVHTAFGDDLTPARFHAVRQVPPEFIMSEAGRNFPWLARTNSTNSSDTFGGNFGPPASNAMMMTMMSTPPPVGWNRGGGGGVRPRKGKRAPMQMNPGLYPGGDDYYDTFDPTATQHSHVAAAVAAVDHHNVAAMMMNDPTAAATSFLMNPYAHMSHLQQQQHHHQPPPPPSPGPYPIFAFPHSFPWSTV